MALIKTIETKFGEPGYTASYHHIQAESVRIADGKLHGRLLSYASKEALLNSGEPMLVAEVMCDFDPGQPSLAQLYDVVKSTEQFVGAEDDLEPVRAQLRAIEAAKEAERRAHMWADSHARRQEAEVMPAKDDLAADSEDVEPR